MPETSGVDTEHESGVREVSSPRSEVRAGKGEESVEIGLVAAEQKSKVRHVDTKGAEATGVTSEARFKQKTEAEKARRLGPPAGPAPPPILDWGAWPPPRTHLPLPKFPLPTITALYF